LKGKVFSGFILDIVYALHLPLMRILCIKNMSEPIHLIFLYSSYIENLVCESKRDAKEVTRDILWIIYIYHRPPTKDKSPK